MQNTADTASLILILKQREEHSVTASLHSNQGGPKPQADFVATKKGAQEDSSQGEAAQEETAQEHRSDVKSIFHRGLGTRLILSFGQFVSRLLIKIRFEGQENLPSTGAFILAPNHVSYFDAMWATLALPKTRRFDWHALAGADLWTNYGRLGRFLMRVGAAIPVDRSGRSISGILTAKRCLDEGHILLIHPEGTRSQDGYVAQLHGGSALLSRQAEVPIIPCYLDGAYEIFGRHQRLPKPWRSFFKRKELVIRYQSALKPENFRSSRQMTEVLFKSLQEMDLNRLTLSERPSRNHSNEAAK